MSNDTVRDYLIREFSGAGDIAWEHLRAEWPQINERTTLSYLPNSIGPYLFTHHIDPAEITKNDLRKVSYPLPGLEALLWRRLGKLFNRQDWQKKGLGVRFAEPELTTQPRRRQLEIKRLSVRWMGNMYSFNCTYDPVTDIFYIGHISHYRYDHNTGNIISAG